MQEFCAIVKQGNEFKTPVILRTYGTQAKNYACLWVNNSPYHGSGSGSADGYGYHRPSAAAAEAIRTTGIVLNEDISGRGDGAIELAVLAIAKALHPRAKIYVHKAHA